MLVTEQHRTQPAMPGTLRPGVLADLVGLRSFLDGRDRQLEVLFNSKLPRSHLRDELIRMVVIEFGFGRLRSLAHYRRSCKHLGTPGETVRELHRLVEHGLAVLLPGERNHRVWHIAPSQRLVDWYSSQLPRFMAEVEAYLRSRAEAGDSTPDRSNTSTPTTAPAPAKN